MSFNYGHAVDEESPACLSVTLTSVQLFALSGWLNGSATVWHDFYQFIDLFYFYLVSAVAAAGSFNTFLLFVVLFTMLLLVFFFHSFSRSVFFFFFGNILLPLSVGGWVGGLWQLTAVQFARDVIYLNINYKQKLFKNKFGLILFDIKKLLNFLFVLLFYLWLLFYCWWAETANDSWQFCLNCLLLLLLLLSSSVTVMTTLSGCLCSFMTLFCCCSNE